MQISFATPTTLDSPEHVALAEELGFARAWLYDTPQQSPDVWMMLALAAEPTERVGPGPGVRRPRRADRLRAGRARALAAPPDGERRGHRVAGRPRSRTRRGCLRHRLLRP